MMSGQALIGPICGLFRPGFISVWRLEKLCQSALYDFGPRKISGIAKNLCGELIVPSHCIPEITIRQSPFENQFCLGDASLLHEQPGIGLARPKSQGIPF